MSDLKDIFAEAEAEAGGEGYAAEKESAVSTDPNDTTDYEALSYGKLGYKRVQRLRKKAARRRIEVPYLGYELHKPDKPRVVFWIVAAVAIVLMVGVVVGGIFLLNVLVKSLDNFRGIGDLFKAMFRPEVLAASLGFSTLPALMVALAVAMLVLLALIPLLVGLYLVSFVRNAFYLAKCSKEEFAKGYDISMRITRLILYLVLATVLLVVGLYFAPDKRTLVPVVLVYVCFVVVFGGFLAVLLLERSKNAKWFEGLDEAQKQSFLAHNEGLRRISKRLKAERDFWNTLGN